MQSEEPRSGEIVPVPVEELQFRRAEEGRGGTSRRCAVCKSPIEAVYFQTGGQDLCPFCAESIQNAQKAPPVHSLGKAILYGGGAALAGSALYAAVAIVMNLELALLAILIGYMVGKAIRYASKGLGGRPQQILAVLLTYFAITFSYLIVGVYTAMHQAPAAKQEQAETKPPAMTTQDESSGLGALAVTLLGLVVAGPFLELGSNFASGLLSLLIIFFGLRKAWSMTGKLDLLILGPYRVGDSA